MVPDDHTRRGIMKKAAAAGVLPVGFTASYDATRRKDLEQFREDMLESYRLRDVEGEDAMLEYLEDKNYNTTKTSLRFEATRPNEDGVSTQKIEDPTTTGIKLDIYGGKYRDAADKYSVTMSVEYEFDVSCEKRLVYVGGAYVYEDFWTYNSWGEAPVDGAGIIWATDRQKYWKLYNPDRVRENMLTYNNVEWETGSWDRESTGFRVDDAATFQEWNPEGGECKDYSAQRLAGTAGVILQPYGDYSEYDRKAYGSFSHTWEKTTSDVGVSAGIPSTLSVSVTPSDEVDQVRTQTEPDGDTLLIRQSEL